ncbi:uncharacterized protein LOC115951760 [Quercus lobata]|uniref:uncharacterized protein LOC115951760 n=1 Tax=Quercus lobata TaxID=97700 RepID=UPI0012489B90|nr:uncharacterized protein LOC115951760 [Quercus lobata]
MVKVLGIVLTGIRCASVLGMGLVQSMEEEILEDDSTMVCCRDEDGLLQSGGHRVEGIEGARKPAFKNHVRELVHIHDPAILIVMETRVGGVRAKEITDELPFDRVIHTDIIGFAGGLWLLWNEDRVDISQLANTEQEIHVIVKVRSSNLNWLLSAIYASPRCAERQVLWSNLKMMAEFHEMPWVRTGDFNEPLMKGDKFGGRGLSVSRALQFKECLDACSMIDIGFSGPRFTWTNRWEVQALIKERIDRFFVNSQWCLMYPKARVVHLTRCHSDHAPILMEL